MITIRQAQEEDVQELIQLLSYSWAITYNYIVSDEIRHAISSASHDKKKLQEYIHNHNMQFTLAADDSEGKIIGFALFVEKNASEVIIERIYIHPHYQRQGIGQQLLVKSLEYFDQVKTIELKVEEENKKGINFYLKNGFLLIGEAVEKIEDVEFNVKIMRKEV